MRFTWRKVWSITFSIAVIIFAAGLTAWFWPNAGYDINKVHPRLSMLREPFRDVQASYYLDGGSIAVRMIDADGQALNLVFPVESEIAEDGRVTASYKRMFVGDINDPDPVELPFTQDSMNRAIEIVDEFGVDCSDASFERTRTLISYRHHPRDFIRACWLRLWHNLTP